MSYYPLPPRGRKKPKRVPKDISGALDKYIRKGKGGKAALHPSQKYAPQSAAIPVVQQNHIPRTSNTLRSRKDGVILVGTEVFHEIDSTPSFTDRVFGIVPTNVLLFPTAQTLALCFTKAKMKRCSVTFHATASTSQKGRVGMCYVNDPKRNSPINMRELLSYEGADVGPVYRDMQLDCKVDRDYEFFLQTWSGFSDSQLRLEMPGYVCVATDETVTATNGPIGMLSVSYEIEFYDIRAPNQLAATFTSKETQPTTDGYIGPGGAYYQNVKTPDTGNVVGYFGHSEPQNNSDGSSLWEAFESVVVDGGKWLVNTAYDYLVSAVATEDANWGLTLIENPDDDSKVSLVRKIKTGDGTILRVHDSALEAYFAKRDEAVNALMRTEKVTAQRLSHDYRTVFTPYNEKWVATTRSVKDFMRRWYGHRTSPDRSADDIYRARMCSALLVPAGVRVTADYDPLAVVNVSIYLECNEPDKGPMILKAEVVPSTADARTTAVLQFDSKMLHPGCRFGAKVLCPADYEIELFAQSETSRPASNDASAEVNGTRFSIQNIELDETSTDFQSA